MLRKVTDMKFREAQDDVVGTAPQPSGPVPTVFEALVRSRCLSATYNRTAIVLAPHVLYTKHDDLHVDGVVLERDGVVPREYKIGTFKLAGLGDLAVTERPFVRSELFLPGDAKYAGTTLMVVDPA